MMISGFFLAGCSADAPSATSAEETNVADSELTAWEALRDISVPAGYSTSVGTEWPVAHPAKTTRMRLTLPRTCGAAVVNSFSLVGKDAVTSRRIYLSAVEIAATATATDSMWEYQVNGGVPATIFEVGLNITSQLPCVVQMSSLVTSTGPTVSGYDFVGWQTLPARESSEVCPTIVSREAAVCAARAGTVVKASECRDLCTVAI
jgi:hypothetical protein